MVCAFLFFLFFTPSLFCTETKKYTFAQLATKNEAGDTPLHRVGRYDWSIIESFDTCTDTQKQYLLGINNSKNFKAIDCIITSAIDDNFKKAVLEKCIPHHPLTIKHLWLAIEDRSASTVDMCIKHVQASLDIPDVEDGNTALHKAVITNYEFAVKKLLAQNIGLAGVRNFANKTPVELALEGNDESIVRKFKQKNIFTIAHLWQVIQTTKNANVAAVIIQEVKNHINDVDTNHWGRTALQQAVDKEAYKIVKLLCEQDNIDFSHKDVLAGNTVMDIALSKDLICGVNDTIQHIIDKNYLMTGKQLRTWAEKGFFTTKPLPSLDSVLNSQDKQGRTPLFLAVQKSNTNSIRSLIISGANPFIKTHDWLDPSDITSDKTICHLLTTYKKALHSLYSTLQKNKLFTDITPQNLENLPTCSITRLLELIPPEQKIRTCDNCCKKTDNVIPLHFHFLCMSCADSRNHCRQCGDSLYKLRCPACNEQSQHGLICGKTIIIRNASYVAQPCTNNSCKFPWQFIDNE
ncbi:MAG TPA: hypothetical protein VEK38_01260 [Candidatus Bathyarchaeia archaeon]|nr:hypothetical protein [Candidatus Bathyarchaeia archaeon]